MKIGQVYLTNISNWQGDYSVNLIPNIAITSFNIYACPGSRFRINGLGEIIINGTGHLSLNCENIPITSIQAHKSNLMDTIPTIIDYIYQEV